MNPLTQLRKKTKEGFALIVTLILLMLITIIALGLLSLSSTALRSSGVAMARSQAQANARMALALAIGQLQSATGPDQRITASAEVLAPDPANPASLPNRGWVGAWQSDEVDPLPFPDSDPHRQQSFVNWLVTSDGRPPALAMATQSQSGETGVKIRSKSSGADDYDVWVPLVQASDDGRLGWWTVDESAKARANLPVITPANDAEKIVFRHAAPRPVPEALSQVSGFEPTEQTAAALVTPGQLTLGAEKFFDAPDRAFTTYAKSLMVDVKNGGFKKDLNTLFELDEDRLLNLGTFGTWEGGNSFKSAESYVYGRPGDALGARWNTLFEYYNLYKKLTFNGAAPAITLPSSMAPVGQANQGDRSGGYKAPRLVNLSYAFSYKVTPGTNPNGVPAANQHLTLHLMVYVTLWNPFDTRITFPNSLIHRIGLNSRFPLKVDVQLNGSTQVSKTIEEIIGGGYALSNEFYAPGAGSSTFSIGPGESISFCYNPGSGAGSGKFVRWDPNIQQPYYSKEFDPNVWGKTSDRVALRIYPYETNVNPGSNSNFLQYVEMMTMETSSYPNREFRGQPKALSGVPFISLLGSGVQTAQRTFSQVRTMVASNGGDPVPVFGTKMTMKTAGDLVGAGDFTPSFLYSAPESLHNTIYGDPSEVMSSKYVFSAIEFNPGAILDDFLQKNGGYGILGSGDTVTSGQSHFISVALPKVPITSMAQLRHAGMGTGANLVKVNLWNEGGRPNWNYFGSVNEFYTLSPFTSQEVGNSYGHPAIPPDAIEQMTAASIQAGQYQMDDHSYKANAALWDEYFFSSLAPRQGGLFTGSSQGMVQQFEGFLNGDKLLNPRFSANLNGLTAEEVKAKIFNGSTDASLSDEAYLEIAQYLALEGGFNVNSTSVDAWRAVLSSTLGQSLIKEDKGSNSGAFVAGSGAVFSRSDVVLSGPADGSSNTETHYTGYRDLDESAITQLATELVKQVRQRGPFLNLGQFVNRRITNNTDLAISGALQSAIDDSGLNDAIRGAGQNTPGNPRGTSMEFPEAAELGSAAGNTGWLMQADILDPIGPSLVARGDTFCIRAYGDARSPSGEILARATCEAVVQRTPDFVDASEPAGAVNGPQLPVNQTFGRRYEIVQFRWLPSSEN